MTLFSFTVEAINPEEDAGIWMYLGADGTVEEDDYLKIFKQGKIQDTHDLIQLGIASNLIFIAPVITEIKQENWMANCESVQKPVIAGGITVIPVMDESPRELDNEKIFILSGLGFGTGHHETTFQCLEFLQSKEISQLSPKTILDVGTGSGVLAVAAKKLFSSSRITASEIDPLALENAAVNLTLNHLQNQITLIQESFPVKKDKFNLIIANLFSSVLIQLEPQLKDYLNENGLLLISGIKDDQINDIKVHFTSWNLVKESQINGWYAVLFKHKMAL